MGDIIMDEDTDLPQLWFTFGFERNFNPYVHKDWMRDHWHHTIYYSAIYILLIHVTQIAMARQRPFCLRVEMGAWSCMLALFSAVGAARSYSYVFHVLAQRGWHATVCDSGFYYTVPSAFWGYVFAVSKLYELGDTVFIVLRKQPLTFLHWYHHATVLVYCWYSYSTDSPSGLLFGFMNYVVHTVMYSYYMLKALRFHMPRSVRVAVTTLQTSQMFAGIGITGSVFYYKMIMEDCPETDENLFLAIVMYLSYFILFLNFFYKSYFEKSSEREERSETKEEKINKLNPHKTSKRNKSKAE